MSTVPGWQASDQELLAELRALETRLHSTWAEMLSVVAEVDSRGTAGTLGYGTTVELVRAAARVPRGEARARVSAAADVLPGRGLGGASVEPRLPATAAAVAEHVIGAADVAVIRSVLARIPPHIDQEQRAEVEAELARQARTLDAGQLAVLGKRILAYRDDRRHSRIPPTTLAGRSTTPQSPPHRPRPDPNPGVTGNVPVTAGEPHRMPGAACRAPSRSGKPRE